MYIIIHVPYCTCASLDITVMCSLSITIHVLHCTCALWARVRCRRCLNILLKHFWACRRKERIYMYIFKSVQFKPVQFSSIQVSSVQVSSVQFKSVQFNSTLIQVSSVQVKSVRFSPVTFYSSHRGNSIKQVDSDNN